MTKRHAGCRSRLIMGLAAAGFLATAQAEVVTTDQVATPALSEPGAPPDEARARIQQQLEALGVPPDTAAERAGALTQEEAQQLAGRLDTLPAGGALSTTDLLLILLIAILVAIAL